MNRNNQVNVINVEDVIIIDVNTNVSKTRLEGFDVIRVSKRDKLYDFDENTYAKISNTSFHNGVIRMKMLSKLLPDAPDLARGFIGVAFRIDDNDSKFESFYVRPTNGRVKDPVRSNRAFQYFSYPFYTFEYFRNHDIKDYEGPLDIGLNEWISLTAVIEDEKATFFINDSEEPVLIVNKLKHGSEPRGEIGLFVDIGTEAFFRDIEIEYFD